VKRLIVTADDVGLHRGMTDGALQAHETGIVTACSVVANGAAVRFSELFGEIVSRVEIVVTFLALLELIRLKQVRALQRDVFAEIEITGAAP